MTALDMLRRYREHVANFGPTGGNWVMGNTACCPRGFIAFQAGVASYAVWVDPDSERGQALLHLDNAAAEEMVAEAIDILGVGRGKCVENVAAVHQCLNFRAWRKVGAVCNPSTASGTVKHLALIDRAIDSLIEAKKGGPVPQKKKPFVRLMKKEERELVNA